MLPLILTLASFATDRVRSSKDRGATAVEYGLMVALIAAIIILVVAALGRDVLEGFNTVEDNIGGSDA